MTYEHSSLHSPSGNVSLGGLVAITLSLFVVAGAIFYAVADRVTTATTGSAISTTGQGGATRVR
jgi:hypothetical protein